jgi:hypothetical protein
VNVLVDWIEHKVKGKTDMMHRDGPERRDAGKTYEAVIIGGNEMKSQKKTPLPDAECPIFFRVRGEQGPLQTTTVVLSAR